MKAGSTTNGYIIHTDILTLVLLLEDTLGTAVVEVGGAPDEEDWTGVDCLISAID